MTEILRERNRRGEGGKLRADILAGATSLLEQTGSEEAVTLRAVARKVGISAPSIYAHFADRDAIVDAIVDTAFADFNAAVRAATAGEADPVERLRAGCGAYVRFAAERPNRYKLIFERQYQVAGPDEPVPAIRRQSFEALVALVQACIDAGLSASTDATLDSTAIWVALHGYATLHALMPGWPWPNDEALLNRIVYGLGKITSPEYFAS
jgi:AcrR family transcriptional regulator